MNRSANSPSRRRRPFRAKRAIPTEGERHSRGRRSGAAAFPALLPGPHRDCDRRAPRLRRAVVRRGDEAAWRRLHQAGQDAHRADRLHDRRRRHRAHGRDAGRRARRAAGDSLLRGGLDARAGRSGWSWSRSCSRAMASASIRATADPSAVASYTSGVAAPVDDRVRPQHHSRHGRSARSRAARSCRCCCSRSSSASRCCAPASASQPLVERHQPVLGRALRGRRADHAAGADRRVRRDGVHRRPVRHRHAALAGQADARRLPDVRALRRSSCSARSSRPAASACSSSCATSAKRSSSSSAPRLRSRRCRG